MGEAERTPPAAKKYKAPSKHKTFVRRWNAYIEEIANRPNFKIGHTFQLEILCNLYVELEKLNAIIDVIGYTYESEKDRGGGTISRSCPEVGIRKNVLSEIRNYSKMLGLLLVKDSDFSNDRPEDEEWV